MSAISDLSKRFRSMIFDEPRLKESKVWSCSNGVLDTIRSIILSEYQRDEEERDELPFYVLDLAEVGRLMAEWAVGLPQIQPFYAVKCNSDPALLRALAAVGAGFDCASTKEMDAVLSLGCVSPDRIIYASTCKPSSHIRRAAAVGVGLATFDSEEEVEKVRRWHPGCRLLLRIKAPDDGGAVFPLGGKFGALPEEVGPLLGAAKAAGVAVVGVSFHVGSGVSCMRPYREALAGARQAFDAAAGIGLPAFHVLNIGGGFTSGKLFEEAAATIEEGMREYFPGREDLTVMAEPGRFFAETAFSLATKIIGRRARGEKRQYWINDGAYGSFTLSLYVPEMELEALPLPLTASSSAAEEEESGDGQRRKYESTVFGPTCAAVDVVLSDSCLPELRAGDWLVFPNMGAYSSSCGSDFNGFSIAAAPCYLMTSATL